MNRWRAALLAVRNALRFWWRWILRVHAEGDRDNLGIVSAGVAYYAFLAIFPAIAALVSVYGLVTNPVQAEQQLQGLADMLPLEAYLIMTHQMRAVATTPDKALGLGVVGGILLAIWSASKGTNAMVTALNIAYGTKERRGFFHRKLVALLMTFGGILAGVSALVMVAIIPAVMSFLDLPASFDIALNLVRWPLLAILVAFGLTLLYRFAPSARLRGVPKHLGLTPGAILASLLWLLASALFSWYASEFGNYNKTYGSVGAVVVLLLWFSLGAYAILLGAELDSLLAEKAPRTGDQERTEENRNVR